MPTDFLTSVPKQFRGERITFSLNGAGPTGRLPARKLQPQPAPHLIQKLAQEGSWTLAWRVKLEKKCIKT